MAHFARKANSCKQRPEAGVERSAFGAAVAYAATKTWQRSAFELTVLLCLIPPEKVSSLVWTSVLQARVPVCSISAAI